MDSALTGTPIMNWRISYFMAHIPLVMMTITFGSGRGCWRSHWCYLCRLCTIRYWQ